MAQKRIPDTTALIGVSRNINFAFDYDTAGYKRKVRTEYTPVSFKGVRQIVKTDTSFYERGNKVFKTLTEKYIMIGGREFIIKSVTVWDEKKGYWDFYSTEVLSEPQARIAVSTVNGFSTYPYIH